MFIVRQVSSQELNDKKETISLHRAMTPLVKSQPKRPKGKKIPIMHINADQQPNKKNLEPKETRREGVDWDRRCCTVFSWRQQTRESLFWRKEVETYPLLHSRASKNGIIPCYYGVSVIIILVITFDDVGLLLLWFIATGHEWIWKSNNTTTATESSLCRSSSFYHEEETCTFVQYNHKSTATKEVSVDDYEKCGKFGLE